MPELAVPAGGISKYGTKRADVKVLEYGDRLKIYQAGQCLAEYPLPPEGVKNKQFSPLGSSTQVQVAGRFVGWTALSLASVNATLVERAGCVEELVRSLAATMASPLSSSRFRPAIRCAVIRGNRHLDAKAATL